MTRLRGARFRRQNFRTHTFQLVSGKIITGLILEEKKELVKVIENPLAKAEPVILKPSEIDAQQKSPVSIMPKGLLDKLARDEILDLVAYVVSRGKRDGASPNASGNHNHHGH